MLMIDWITAKLPFYYPGIICNGDYLSLNPDGSVEYVVRKRLPVTGSYESSVSIRTLDVDENGDTSVIEFSGNPVKFLQGHNLFGSSDLLNLVYEITLMLSKKLGIIQPEKTLILLTKGAYFLSRVDINRMFTLDNRAEVLAYLYSMSNTSRTRRQSAVTSGSTVYLNKSSKYWIIKMYSKGQEIELPRNKRKGLIQLPSGLVEWADATLRIELTLKSMELRHRGLHLAANWHTIEESDLFDDYAERIQMAEQRKTDDLFLKIKSRPAAASYQMWCDGHDLRQILSKPTFYRHRKILLEHGIDISIAAPEKDKPESNVVPFVKTLVPRPATLPDWVQGTDLYFEPRRICKP